MDSVGIKEILNVINILVKPCTLGESCNLMEVFNRNLIKVSELRLFNVTDLQLLKTECNLKLHSDDGKDVCWSYVCTCLEALLLLKKHLQNDENELLSVSQTKSVESIFEFIISMGLLPYLLPGVGLAIDKRCPNASLFSDLINNNSINDVQKYNRLCVVTRGILSLIEVQSISSLFLSKHMEDLFAVLCQLTIPQFKEPTQDLLTDREYFQSKFTNLVATSYQPLVINALMLLQGNKESPRWLRLGVSKLLTQRLMEKGGVLATVRAIQHSADYDSPTVVTRLESIARLIATPHMKDKTQYYNMIIPQILQLLKSDANLVRIGVLCCRVLYETNIYVFKQHISSIMMTPLVDFSQNFSEAEITQCINSLHKCFAVPGGDMWSVPVEALIPLSKVIYTIYCKICDSALVIKTPIEELLWTILSKTNDESLTNIFQCLLLNEMNNEIKELPENMNVVFGDEGGITIKSSDDESDKIEYSKCLLKLLEEKDNSGKITKKLFLTLLNFCSTLSDEISEVKLYVTELLADLAENEKVQKNIIDDSQSITSFIETLINNQLKYGDCSTELLCIALVLLMTIMNDMRCKKDSDWSKFKYLSVLLPKLTLKTKSTELKMLCDEVLNILTQGVRKSEIGSKNKSANYSKGNKINKLSSTKSECEIALEEACDPLLPVRGHAILELTKLISAGNSEAKAKKNAILCIFQENLKNEDTYLYLSAIEGMASLAAEFPDTVLVTLIEEYSRNETSVRLKVGESLMRVVRRLGDMIPVYKNELLNSFLSGVRDTDDLVRASSLSNVGELCQLLGFRIGSIAAEILNCVESVVATDRAPEPRRAAVMLLTLVLRGLHKDALIVLEPVLLPLYRTLKKIYETDKDDVVKLHAQLALEELNNATHAFLLPPENMSKRIFVLDSS